MIHDAGFWIGFGIGLSPYLVVAGAHLVGTTFVRRMSRRNG